MRKGLLGKMTQIEISIGDSCPPPKALQDSVTSNSPPPEGDKQPFPFRVLLPLNLRVPPRSPFSALNVF